ncbi:hypothetical protein ACNJYD_21180 [Bradyrhizobium sp. DASA03005]|uniref:hypothetical protein n=1 Tax=Bradyrhizobium TaxID=374 RepID=UPI001FE86BB4|nr:hypothetical protein [Bradyrhizobium liaoningense]
MMTSSFRNLGDLAHNVGAHGDVDLPGAITARGAGVFLKPRTLRRDWTSVSNSTS